MSKNPSSSRIPRFGEGSSRIPMPGSIRIQQSQSHHLPAPSLRFPQQKFMSNRTTATRIIRPNSASGVQPPVSTVATLNKSISGDRFTEATTAVKRIITKPEKYEKNIEMKSQKGLMEPNMNLEKVSKESLNKKLSNTSQLTRSDTFVCSQTDFTSIDHLKYTPIIKTSNDISRDMIMSTPIFGNLTKVLDKSNSTINNMDISISGINTTRTYIPNALSFTQTISTPIVNNQTKILEKSIIKRNDTFKIPHDKTVNNFSTIKNLGLTFEMIQSTPQLNMPIDSRESLFGTTRDLINSPVGNSTRKTDVYSPQCQDSNEMLDLSNNKTVRRSATFDQLTPEGNQDDIAERLIDVSCPSLDNLDGTSKLKYTSSANNLNEDTTNSKFLAPEKKNMKLQLSPQSDCDRPIIPTVKASSRASLIARTPDDFLATMEQMDIEGAFYEIPSGLKHVLSHNTLQDLKNSQKPRFSFGLDLTESTLDCSIELCDISLASAANSSSTAGQMNGLKKQNSFEMDESLGILTPDQMKEFLDSNTQNTNNLELPFLFRGSKMTLHQMRIDQTPSPEDLPLDPVDVKTDVDIIMSLRPNASNIGTIVPQTNTANNTELSHADNSESKIDQMTKSNVSKVSTSFITSITSITSLDNGYQGDGEMSRPASRGADHSPSNGPRVKQQIARQPSFNNQIPIRRQDPMTDSDFFTESDADIDIMHRGDRRAQVIDGQLYGPMVQQPTANVFISEQPEMEDSCMESSGIFTDVENRCEDDQNRTIHPNVDVDMSPDGSTDTVKSKHLENITTGELRSPSSLSHQGQILHMTDSQTSSTINSSLSSDRISISTDYCRDSFNATAAQKPQPQILATQKAFSIHNNGLNSNSATKLVCNQSPLRKHVSPKNFEVSLVPQSKLSNKSVQSVSRKNKSLKSVEMPTDKIGPKRYENLKKSPNSSNNSSSISIASNVGNTLKSPIRVNGGGTDVAVAVATNRKFPPNKWDAVMNKIAENKSQEKLKKKLLQVKSKVSTGVVLRKTSNSANKCTSINNLCNNSSCYNHIQSVQNNKINNNVILSQQPSVDGTINLSSGANSGLASPQSKRLTPGAIKRGRSYSKESSLSDLSLSGGSPKLLAKTPQRASKKRDVRNLSISPSDLGPPPKTQTIASTPNGITRSKNLIAISSQKRTPLTNQPTAGSTILITKASPPLKKSVNRRIASDQKPARISTKDHNKQNVTTPKIIQNVDVKINSTKSGNLAIGATTNNSAVSNGKLKNLIEFSSSTIPNGNHETSLHKQKQSQPSKKSKHNNGADSSEPQIRNVEKKVNCRANEEIYKNNKSLEALGVLIKYLAYDLDAFSCPAIKNECLQAQKCLLETKNALEEIKTTCNELQNQLQDKDQFYITREQELQELHRCEISKVETSLTDIQSNAQDRISSLELELSLKNEENKRKFQSYCQEAELKIKQKDQELQAALERESDLLQQIQKLSTNEAGLRDKIQETEDTFSEHLQAANQREQELSDKVIQLQKQVDFVKCEAEQQHRLLEEKLHIASDEIAVMRHSLSLDSKVFSSDSKSVPAATKAQMLQNEVESLRCVLEIKQNEIADLRKKNQELARANDELQALQIKYSSLEIRMEDIQIQLKSKAEEEKELVVKLKHTQDQCSQETKNRTRLTLHNEELQWKLRQNTEKYQATLTELSKSYQDKTTFMSCSRASFNSQENSDSHNSSLILTGINRSNGSGCCFIMDDISPPASPIIKGVVEKSDSVSWVLEMDDETPEVLASRMVKRAGSFRSNFSEKNSTSKRQLSLPTGGLNPLQQSVSATMVLPREQHSIEAPEELSRIRSKSVTIKGSEQKKLIRQSSGGSRKIDTAASWKEPICSSSPYMRRGSSRNSPPSISNLTNGAKQMPKSLTASESPDLFPRKQSRHLITCDTSALSTQALKKKCQQQEIQESAGEAMVSGANSEDDENCASSSSASASSDESSLDNIRNPNSTCKKRTISIEDVLLLEKINQLGTPMDVSWSSDATDEQFAPTQAPATSESIV